MSFLAARIYALLIMCFCFNSVCAQQVLNLNQALAIAYANNPELQAEISKARAMHGAFIQSGLYPNPQLALSGENIGGSGSYKGFESAETTLSVVQPIPLGGRLNYLKKATYADYLAAIARIQVQKTQIYTLTGKTYIDALYASEWHQVTKKLITLNKHIVDAIERRVTAGAGAVLDLNLARLRLGEARIQENKARRELLILQATLARLLGQEEVLKTRLVDQGISHRLKSWSQIKQAIDKNPQLIAMHKQVVAKRATITAAKKAVWPDLAIQLGARHFSDDQSNAAVLATSAQLPVSDRNQGNIARAEAEYTQSLQQLRGLSLSIKQNAYIAFLEAEQSDYEAHLVTHELLPLARKSLKVAQEGYQMGRYTYIELSTALNTLYEEERHYQQAHANYHKALIELNGLLGLVEAKS